MTSAGIGPLSRPFPLHRVTAAGADGFVETTPAEREALAADLGLPAIHDLRGTFRITGGRDRVRVAGRVTARIEQTCVVTLDPFEATVDEEVALEFREPDPGRAGAAAAVDVDLEHDPPEDLLGDRLDLGAITAEFLALGLDPYPRKPGIAFEPVEPPPLADSPFAKLGGLNLPKEEG